MAAAACCDLISEAIKDARLSIEGKYRAIQVLYSLEKFIKDAMATNHSNIGSYFGDKHLPGLTKMVINARKSKGEELFKPGGSPEGSNS